MSHKVCGGLGVCGGSVVGLCGGFKVVPHSGVEGAEGLSAKTIYTTCEYIIKSQSRNVTKRCIQIFRICFFKTIQPSTTLSTTVYNPPFNLPQSLKNYPHPPISCSGRIYFFGMLKIFTNNPPQRHA